MPALTEAEKDKIRVMTKQNMQNLFIDRQKEDEAIAKEEKEIKELATLFKDNNLLTPGDWGYPDSYYGVDQRLEELLHFRDKVLRDTKRKGLTDGASSNKVNISHADLVALTYAWYTEPDGPQKYAQMLKDKFGIIIAPKAEEMSGTWPGTFTILKFNLPDTVKSDSQQEVGCDLGDIKKQLAAMKGKPLPSSFNMQINPDGSGTMTVSINANGEGSEPTVLPCTYRDGKITASLTKDEATLTFNGLASSNNTALVVSGTWSMVGTSNSQSISLSGKWKASKPLPAKTAKPVPAP